MNLENVIKTYPWTYSTLICNRKSYLIEEFVLIIVTQWNAQNIGEYIGASKSSVGRAVSKYIPEVQKGSIVLGKKVLTLFNLKRCNCCKEIKEYTEFSVCTRDGYQSKCKECKKGYYIRYADEILLRMSAYYKDNKEACKLRARKYQMRRLQRTPLWADELKIEQIYKNRPKGYHVDHIIPLQGDKVSGLHIHTNLQYLTETENISKGNKYEPA